MSDALQKLFASRPEKTGSVVVHVTNNGTITSYNGNTNGSVLGSSGVFSQRDFTSGDKQPKDAQLTVIANTSPVSGQVIVFTGPTSAKLVTISDFATTFLDDTSLAAVQATLGIGATSGGFTITSAKSGDYTAVANDLVLCSPSGATGNFTIKCPATPSANDSFGVLLQNQSYTHNVLMDGNGSVFNNAAKYTMLQTNDYLELKYINSTLGWQPVVDKIQPIACKIFKNTAVAVLGGNSNPAQIALDLVTINDGLCASVARSGVLIRRTGNYLVETGAFLQDFDSGYIFETRVNKNGSAVKILSVRVSHSLGAPSDLGGSQNHLDVISSGTVLGLYCVHNGPSNRNLYAYNSEYVYGAPHISITEQR